MSCLILILTLVSCCDALAFYSPPAPTDNDPDPSPTDEGKSFTPQTKTAVYGTLEEHARHHWIVNGDKVSWLNYFLLHYFTSIIF